MNLKSDIIVAIDGHSSCGKSSYAKAIAKSLNYAYVDTGAMYRSVTLFSIEKGILKDGAIDVQKLIGKLPDIDIAFKFDANKQQNITYLNEVNVENEIRGIKVSSQVSKVSAIKEVRQFLVSQQQKMGIKKRVVMDGRDIGSVVFPNAEVKIFLTAKPEIRAQRRYDELSEKGDRVDFEEILQNVKERDILDQSRKESPLMKVDDAILLDNSHMSIPEQMIWFNDLLKSKGLV